MAVKDGQIGYNESPFMLIFYAYTLGFSVAMYILLLKNQEYKHKI